MKTWFRNLVAAFVLALSPASLQAADLGYSGPVVEQCVPGHAALYGVGSKAELKGAVVQLMDEAIAVADSPAWIGSSRPVFLWASETKVACGKAFGYLRSGYRDAEYLYKCECFHARMTKFMN